MEICMKFFETYVRMDFITKEKYKNGVEVIVRNNGMSLLNEKIKEGGLSHANLPGITRKYHSDYRKHRYQLVDEPKKQLIRIFFA